MKVIIEAPFSINKNQEEQITEKLEGFEKFSKKITKCIVYIKMMDDSGPNIYTTQVETHLPGPVIFATASDSDLIKSFNKAANQVKSQLIKKKEQIKNHRIDFDNIPKNS